MKNRLTFLAVLLVTVNAVKSQTPAAGQPPNIIQNSPEVSALQKYGDIPVSIYTGVPDISIPLYTVKCGDIQVPVSVSYHASGIKVADEASRVGLGWVLNAGGVIGRTIMGADDLYDVGNSKNWNNSDYVSAPDVINSYNTTSFGLSLIQPLVNGSGVPESSINVPVTGTMDATWLRSNYDFQPDYYTFNFPGGAGKFITRRNKDVILATQAKISVKCLTNNNVNSWEIKTADGTTYLFAQIESYKEPGGAVLKQSAWYLTKITSQKGDEVNFNYQTVTNNYTKSVGSYFESRDDNQWVAYSNQANSPNSVHVNVFNGPIAGREYSTVYLSSIAFKTGEVQFVYSNDRDDIVNDVKLQELRIYKKDAVTSTLTLFKEWEFSQDYFTGISDRDFTGAASTAQETKRLKLTAITEKDASGNSLPPYTFTYANESDVGGLLPAKTSFARDHWGYYNGKTSNESLIPTFTYSYSGNVVASLLGFMGDNRNTSPFYSKLFALTQINYPTGGKTVFDYESNEFNVANSQNGAEHYDMQYPETREVILSKTYDGRITGLNPVDYTNPGDKIFDLTDMYVDDNPFVSTQTSKVSIEARFLLRTAKEPTDLNFLFNNKVTFSFRSIDGVTNTGPENLFSNINETPSSTAPATYYFSHSTGGYTWVYVRREYYVVPGKYTWQLYLDQVATGQTDYVFSNVLLNVTYNALTSKEPDNVQIFDNGTTVYATDYAGGLRIKRISNYTNDNDNRPIIKRYVYRELGQDNKWRSTGKRMSRPVYSYFEKAKVDYQLPDDVQIYADYFQHLMRESDSNIPINASLNGTIVGYDKVTVLNGENGENGKTEYEFDNTPDKVFEYFEADLIKTRGGMLPRKPPVNCITSAESNGNLLKQTDYKFENNIYSKVREIDNGYTNYYLGLPLYMGIEKRPYFGSFINGGFPSEEPSNIYLYPALYASRNILLSTEVKTYSSNDATKYISETTTYDYDQYTHLQLKSVTKTLSNGDILFSNYKYPADYTGTDATAVLTDMAGEKFMHASPVQENKSITKSISNNTFGLSSIIHTYKTENLRIVPDKVYIFETAKPFDPALVSSYVPSSATYPTGFNSRLQFEKYDEVGNILQLRKTGNIPMCYLYDYKNSLPVAQVTNATNAEIAYTSFEADGTGNWNFTGAISSGSPGAMLPTGNKYYNLTPSAALTKTAVSGNKYIISYWSNSSSAFNISGGSGDNITGKTINGWTYHEHKITASSTTLGITGTGLIDEVRLYPEKAQMVSYTFEPLVGMTSQCDVNNKISYFEYDAFGRLKLIRDQDNNIIKTFDYKYQQ